MMAQALFRVILSRNSWWVDSGQGHGPFASRETASEEAASAVLTHSGRRPMLVPTIPDAIVSSGQRAGAHAGGATFGLTAPPIGAPVAIQPTAMGRPPRPAASRIAHLRVNSVTAY
jgi:hypothetical protein